MNYLNKYSLISLFNIYIVSIILLFGATNIKTVNGVFGTSGRGLQSSNYLTVSRSTLKNGNVITLIPQGWLNRALKGVRTGTVDNYISIRINHLKSHICKQ